MAKFRKVKTDYIIEALNDCQLVFRGLPSERWPCDECGRIGPDEPPKSKRVTKEDGHSYTAGCYYCNNIERIKRARRSLNIAMTKLTDLIVTEK